MGAAAAVGAASVRPVVVVHGTGFTGLANAVGAGLAGAMGTGDVAGAAGAATLGAFSHSARTVRAQRQLLR